MTSENFKKWSKYDNRYATAITLGMLASGGWFVGFVLGVSALRNYIFNWLSLNKYTGVNAEMIAYGIFAVSLMGILGLFIYAHFQYEKASVWKDW